MTKKNLTYLTLFLCITAFLCQSGCVYYNTFFNAKKSFNEAEKLRSKTKYTSNTGGDQQYKKAIEKALKVIENHPNTKYYDDALYVIGVSYYSTKQFALAGRRLRELIANYPESPFIKDAELYLAKTKLKSLEEEEAMELFENIFNSDYEKSLKSEAAMGLGKYYFDKNEVIDAQPYFLSVRDSLGNEIEKKRAQEFIADGYFKLFLFADAIGAYLQLSEMNLTKLEKYHALYTAAESAFKLMRIDDGMDYLNKLLEDEAYFSSTGELKLAIAQGKEFDGEYEEAEEIYLELKDNQNKKVASEANYQLGLIAQLDNDDLLLAKEYYDAAVKLNRSTESGKDALYRSVEIGKLETFARTLEIDSSTTQANIDDAAFTQIQLAQIYWMSLEKPDTAMMEMQYVIDSFPTAFDVPTAMIALSQMYREHKHDTLTADSILHLMLENHPASDRVPEVLELLNLIGTDADTGYAKLYLDKAELFFADQQNYDSAKYYYQYIVDHFPESEIYLQARFAILWIVDEFQSPGDSSVFYSYNAFVDSFPATPWARKADSIVRIANREKRLEERQNDTTGSETRDENESENLLAGGNEDGEEEYVEDEYLDPLEALYIDPKGKKALLMRIEPMQTRREFLYPQEAYKNGWEGDLYFQLLLDFSGEVVEYKLKIASSHEAINREASAAVESMIFDMVEIPAELQERWFVYKFIVIKPDKLR